MHKMPDGYYDNVPKVTKKRHKFDNKMKV